MGYIIIKPRIKKVKELFSFYFIILYITFKN